MSDNPTTQPFIAHNSGRMPAQDLHAECPIITAHYQDNVTFAGNHQQIDFPGKSLGYGSSLTLDCDRAFGGRGLHLVTPVAGTVTFSYRVWVLWHTSETLHVHAYPSPNGASFWRPD